ncbi:MAG: hypothetical protein ACLVHV_11300 [Oscillospiraceae bacterium]
MKQPSQQAAQGLGQEGNGQGAQKERHQAQGRIADLESVHHPGRPQNHSGKHAGQHDEGKDPAQENHPGPDGHGQQQGVVLGIINLALGGKDAAEHRQSQSHQPRRGEIQPVQARPMVGRSQLAEHEAEQAAENHSHIGEKNHE